MMDRTALLARGADEVAAGRISAAEATYRSILAVVPLDPDALRNLGAVPNIAGRHEAAEACCRAALAAQPGFWAALGDLGTALHTNNVIRGDRRLCRGTAQQPEGRECLQQSGGSPGRAVAHGGLARCPRRLPMICTAR